MQQRLSDNSGQAIIITTIVVSLIGLAITSSLVVLSLNSFNGIVVAQQFSKAQALNNACAEKALYLIRQQASYLGSGSVTIESNTCDFTVSSQGGNSRLVSILGKIGSVTRRAEIILTASVDESGNTVIDIQSWKDVP